MWFAYELSDAGVWEAVCYRVNYGDPALDDRPRTNLVAVPASCIGDDGDPLFGRLRERFPLEVVEG
jgi:hypothetical protein